MWSVMKRGPLFMGWTLNEIVTKQLYKQIGYDCFRDFVNSEDFGYGKTQAYNWINAYNEFKDIENVHLVDKLGIKRLLVISAVKNVQEREELIEKAPKLTVKQLEDEKTGRFVQNIDSQVSEGDSQIIKYKRIGNQLLEKVIELIKYFDIFKNQFNEDIDNIDKGIKKWLDLIKSYPSNEELEEIKSKLLISKNELKKQ